MPRTGEFLSLMGHTFGREVVMLSSRLVGLIEAHSEQITTNLLRQVHKEPRLSRFSKLPDSELLRRFTDVCQHLGKWLSLQDEELLEDRYASLGRERFEEGIPLQEVVLAAQLFKQGLLTFARQQGVDQTAFEIYSEEELERLVSGFFDRVVYYIVAGYQQALRASVEASA